MNTTEKKPRAKKAKPTAAEIAAKIHQTALDLPQPVAPELAFVPLELIDTREQVRTELNDETLAELAADIGLRGILQPVLLRPNGDGRFLMIAGHRRLIAARLAGLTAVPALAGDLDDEAADDMQLAENIQREDLSLGDEARAVRKLFDRLGSLQAVADRVHKSKPWVSKRVSLTAPELHWSARQLLDNGQCEDIETLLALSKVYYTDAMTGAELENLIREGKAGRQTARDYISKAEAAADGRAAAWEAEREERERAAIERNKQREAKAAQEQAEEVARQAEFVAGIPPELRAAILPLFDRFEKDEYRVWSYLRDVTEAIADELNPDDPE